MHLEHLNGTSVMYHVTPAENIDGIDGEGINPEYAKGKMKASWYVTKNHIQWAILHVCIRHNISPTEVVVCATLVDYQHMKRTALQGRFYTYKIYHPESFTPSTHFVES